MMKMDSIWRFSWWNTWQRVKDPNDVMIIAARMMDNNAKFLPPGRAIVNNLNPDESKCRNKMKWK